MATTPNRTEPNRQQIEMNILLFSQLDGLCGVGWREWAFSAQCSVRHTYRNNAIIFSAIQSRRRRHGRG